MKHDAATLRPAVVADAAALRAVLAATGLPVDLAPDWFPSRVVVAEQEGAVVGAAGFEQAGDAGLLRSVVVAPAQRGTGLGARLAGDRLAAMTRSGCREAYLLTTTAAPWFERLGFEKTDRDMAPEALRRLAQFASVCPASAVCMRRALV